VNITNTSKLLVRRAAAATVVTAALLLAACAPTPVVPGGMAQARAELARLQSDANLAPLVPAALQEAEAAMQLAEQADAESEVVAHRVYIAGRKIEIARATAEARHAEVERATLVAQRNQSQLAARTREVGVARTAASTARMEADSARMDAAMAQQKTAALESEIAAIDNFKNNSTVFLSIMKELTVILPANAWLTRIKITETMVEIEGYADAATDIMPKLEASSYFRKAEFTSATTRDPKKNVDRFAIKMEIGDDKKDTKEAVIN